MMKEFVDSDIIGISEFIKNRLYFVTYKSKIPESTKRVHYFTANDEYSSVENKEPISRVSLGTVAQFCIMLNKKLTQDKYKERVIVNYSTGSERKRSNAVVIMGVYAFTHFNMDTKQVAEKLAQHSTISPLDYLMAIQKGIILGFVDLNNFNLEDFYSLDDVKLNWIVPKKLLMFNGPIEVTNKMYLSPRRYIKIFRYMGVQAIIRICHVKYDANPFVSADIPHFDINIAGSVPTDQVLMIFLELCEECEEVILVHCRENLGRAGILVAAYLVKHFGLAAEEAVAWVRICTSECILEAQKNWLKDKEAALLKAGKKIIRNRDGSPQLQGICAYKNKVDTIPEESDNANHVDVTAQLENEIRVVETAKPTHNKNM